MVFSKRVEHESGNKATQKQLHTQTHTHTRTKGKSNNNRTQRNKNEDNSAKGNFNFCVYLMEKYFTLLFCFRYFLGSSFKTLVSFLQ